MMIFWVEVMTPQCSWHNKNTPVHALSGAVVAGQQQFLFDVVLPKSGSLKEGLSCIILLLPECLCWGWLARRRGGSALTFWEGFWQEVQDPAADGWSGAQLCQFGHRAVEEASTERWTKIYKNQRFLLLEMAGSSPESCCSSVHLLALEVNWCGSKAVGRLGMMRHGPRFPKLLKAVWMVVIQISNGGLSRQKANNKCKLMVGQWKGTGAEQILMIYPLGPAAPPTSKWVLWAGGRDTSVSGDSSLNQA